MMSNDLFQSACRFVTRSAMALGIAVLATQSVAPAVADDISIRRFEAHVPEEVLADMRHRIAETRWPDRETVNDQSQGIQLARLKPLVEYWGSSYDWRKA